MSGPQLAVVISLNVLVDAVVVWVVIRCAGGNWNRLADAHPPVPVLEPAESRRYQSFRLGLFNLGFSVHVTADTERLHLTPMMPLRLIGMRAMSLPWEAIELKPHGLRKRWRTARVGGGLDLHGPAWGLGLAEGERPVGGRG